jgi:hypothetical protein
MQEAEFADSRDNSDETGGATTLTDSESTTSNSFFQKSLGVDAVFASLGMLALTAWGLATLLPFQENCHNVSAWAVLGCGISGFLVILCLKNSKRRIGALSLLVLIFFAFIGLKGSNPDASALFKLLSHAEVADNFIRNDRERWEAVALMSTAFMALIYWDSVQDLSDCLSKKTGFFGINSITALLITSLFFLGCAIVWLHDAGTHYWLIIGVASCFCAIDCFIYNSLKNVSADNCRAFVSEAKTLMYLVDIPILIGLLALRWYFSGTGCPDSSDSLPVNMKWCEPAYPFLAGALAFQMISFNLIYSIFQLGLHQESSAQKGTT